MKRKGLTIFFFSVMALAATPRAMRHFQNYVAAAQNQARAELLQLLLNIGAPAAESLPATQEQQSQLASTTPVENRAQSPAVRQRANAPAAPAQPVALNRGFEFDFTRALPAPVAFSNDAAQSLEHLRPELEARSRTFVRLAPEGDAVVPSPGGKTEYIKSLLQAGKVEEQKVACDLQKEMIALVRSNKRLPPLARMKLVKAALEVPAAAGAAAPAVWEFTESTQATDPKQGADDSTR